MEEVQGLCSGELQCLKVKERRRKQQGRLEERPEEEEETKGTSQGRNQVKKVFQGRE